MRERSYAVGLHEGTREGSSSPVTDKSIPGRARADVTAAAL